MKKKLLNLEERAKKDIKTAETDRELEVVRKKYLDKKGELSLIFQELKKLDSVERMEIGAEANKIKKYISETIDNKKKKDIKIERADGNEFFDPTLPGVKPKMGHLHPLTQSMNRAREIFEGMGFTVAEGPEMEDEWHNFDALNFPKDHPAREMQDTLFIKQKNRESLSEKERMLMRTHTSPVQVRHMLANEPPFRIIVPGRVFRNEATDASHEVNFHQIEGLMIDRDISVANFKAVMEEFCRSFYEKDVNIRLRPSFFPFTEPSFEVDMSCSTCDGKGCSVCSQTGWLEIIGAGMVHPNVLKNSGINPTKWQGFAFGMGWDRIVMMKYKIDDVRLFYGGDLRFLNQF